MDAIVGEKHNLDGTLVNSTSVAAPHPENIARMRISIVDMSSTDIEVEVYSPEQARSVVCRRATNKPDTMNAPKKASNLRYSWTVVQHPPVICRWLPVINKPVVVSEPVSVYREGPVTGRFFNRR
jgi:hypothetical protein